MIDHFAHISAATVAATTGLIGGAALAVGLPDASATVWIGGILGGAFTLGVAASAKSWVEGQISKVVALPTREELFEKFDVLAEEMKTMNEFYQKQIAPLSERVARIEERHETLDRMGG